MTKNKPDFSEEDIQKTILYLRTKNPKDATRENAIKLLKGMKIAAHMVAHELVHKNKKN